MMNLDEILKGIGSQMAKAATPPWSQPDQAPAIQPQLQNPMPDMGAFGSYLSNGSPSAPGPLFNPASAGTNPDAWGSINPTGGSPWASNQGAPQSAGAWDVNSALGHIKAATAPTAPAHSGTVSANDAETEAYIRQAATARGINPDTAVKVWSNEGRSSTTGDSGSSFGPYQLHYGNVAGGGNAVGGLGDDFTKTTGLDARDPATWQAQVDYTLDHARSGGWGPWHGAAASGVGQWDGIGTKAAAAAPNAQAGQSIMAKAQPFIGTPYAWGGKTPQSGFDCSGLAGYLTTGKAESTRTLYAKSVAINPADAQAGDLVFYNMANSTGPSDEHVATSIGNGQIVQAGGTQHNVNIANANQFTAPGWQPEYRRLTGA